MAAVALLSGGLDSVVAAAHAARHGGVRLALTFDYGQRAAAREIAAAAAISRWLGAEHRVVALPFLGECASSVLTDGRAQLPEPSAAGLDDPEEGAARARAVWVPNRNGVFIHAAAAFAQARRLARIVVGFNREEARTFPDNRAAYLEAVNRSLAFTLDPPVAVTAPTAELDKVEIARLGLSLGAPLGRVWSCYGGGPGHCLRCESCLRLKRALEAAGVWPALREQIAAGA